MLMSSDEVGEDVFFDSLDYDIGRSCDSMSFEESVSLVFGKSKYEIWRKEPGSVQERRERYLADMGLCDFAPKTTGNSHFQEIDTDNSFYGRSPKVLGFERITDCGGAVLRSSWASFSNRVDDDLAFSRRSVNGGTKFAALELEQDSSDRQSTVLKGETPFRLSPSVQQLMTGEALAHEEHDGFPEISKKKMRKWWKYFTNKKKMGGGMCKSDDSVTKEPKTNRVKVLHNNKKFMELTAVYMGQEIQAHKGFIWTVKFSPDGQYLASGGEDGVVRIWRVTSTDASSKYITGESSSKFVSNVKGGKFIFGSKNQSPTPVVIPEKAFKIEESPVREFHGHTSDVLDLSWSNSNCLLSSSKDKTVRLWRVGCDKCLNIFYHSNYVTCVQFNPVDNGYFISGSIDGKVRIWGLSERRVVDWADVRHIVTAICYQPDGQRCIVGSITGNCRFYDASGNNLQLDAQISIQGRNKSSGNRITVIQFCSKNYQRVIITSADSKVRIIDGVNVIHKYRGLRNSGSQMSASFTSNGRHIISVGEDSRVYIWNYDGFFIPSSKQAKSVRSCEHFLFEGVSVAVPWSGMEPEQEQLQSLEPLDASSWSRDSKCFSHGRCFSMDSPSKSSATWPEEKLPAWDVPVAEHNHHDNNAALSATWNLVILTAGWDGVIRTFHNYGLPVRI